MDNLNEYIKKAIKKTNKLTKDIEQLDNSELLRRIVLLQEILINAWYAKSDIKYLEVPVYPTSLYIMIIILAILIIVLIFFTYKYRR